MDVNTLRTILLVLCFLAFLGIVWWAYSKKNTGRHEEAANLPFADDELNDATVSGLAKHRRSSR
ncbi:MAG: cbb3-type cytochrome c oxidase subunit 3 [Burkholderiaceae bacterium]